MARPRKNTVDYFPHQAIHGKTLFIIQSLYGNDGYAFWFKLLELLCISENLFFEVKSYTETLFLSAKTNVAPELCEKILKTLSELGAIDAELWEKRRIIWSDKLVENVKQAFCRRGADIPKKPMCINEDTRNAISDDRNSINSVDNQQIKLNKIKLNNNKYTSYDFEKFWEAYPRKEGKGYCRKIWNKLKPSEELVQKMLESIKIQKQTDRWLKNDGQFIPMPSTWLNQERWEDEINDGGIYDKRNGQKRSGLDEWAVRQGLFSQGDENNRDALPINALDTTTKRSDV